MPKRSWTAKLFLGIEIHHLPNGYLLKSQIKYIKDLLTKANMATAIEGSSTASSAKLCKIGSNNVCDPTLFRFI